MTTLFEAVQKVGRKLVAVRTGTVDSGNATTMVDAMRYEGVDFWNKGTFLNLSNLTWAHITNFVNGTGTFTHPTITANDADDKYMVIIPRYPLDSLIEGINAAIQECKIPKEDITSLDTITNTLEYALPTGVTRQTLRQVWVNTNTTAKPEWKLMRNWDVKFNDGGQESLILQSKVEAGKDIRLVYTGFPSALQETTDAISPYIPDDKWLPQAALNVVESRLHFKSGSKHEDRMIMRFENQVKEAKGVVIKLPQIRGKLVATW